MRILTHWDLWVLSDGSLYTLGLDVREMHILLCALLVLFLVDLIRYRKKVTLDVYLEGETLWFRWGVVLFLIFYILMFGVYGPEYDASSFIYFQF